MPRLRDDDWLVSGQAHERLKKQRDEARVRLKCAEEDNERTRKWAEQAFDEQRRLAERCTHLYGLAARLGATDDELRGGSDGVHV